MGEILVVAYNLWMRADVTQIPLLVSQFRTLSMAPEVSLHHVLRSVAPHPLPASAFIGGATDRSTGESSVQG